MSHNLALSSERSNRPTAGPLAAIAALCVGWRRFGVGSALRVQAYALASGAPLYCRHRAIA
jgi:hypothetical protein